MPTFTFDIVSDYDKAEMNNVFMQAEKDMSSRYDFKGTPAEIQWLDNKSGFKIIAQSDMQLESILDIVRKKLVARNQSSKVLDLTTKPIDSNMKLTQDVPFKQGLDQDKAKKVAALIRENHPKAKPQIQGDLVRVSSGSKDELQAVMQTLRAQEFDFPLSYTNFR